MTRTSFRISIRRRLLHLTTAYGGNKKKCKKATKVKTKTCEYDKAEMELASREGVSLGLAPKGSPKHQMQDTDLNSLFDADLI